MERKMESKKEEKINGRQWRRIVAFLVTKAVLQMEEKKTKKDARDALILRLLLERYEERMANMSYEWDCIDNVYADIFFKTLDEGVNVYGGHGIRLRYVLGAAIGKWEGWQEEIVGRHLKRSNAKRLLKRVLLEEEKERKEEKEKEEKEKEEKRKKKKSEEKRIKWQNSAFDALVAARLPFHLYFNRRCKINVRPADGTATIQVVEWDSEGMDFAVPKDMDGGVEKARKFLSGPADWLAEDIYLDDREVSPETASRSLGDQYDLYWSTGKSHLMHVTSRNPQYGAAYLVPRIDEMKNK